MKQVVHSILSVVAAFVRSCPRIARQQTLYPESPRKPFWRRYFECLYLRFRDGAVCMEYTAAGLDVKGRDVREYITEGMRVRKIQPVAEVDLGTRAAVLYDKELFAIYCSNFSIPAVKTLFRFEHHANEIPAEFRELFKAHPALILKCVTGWCGQTVWKVSAERIKDVVCSLTDGETYIVQPIVKNHPSLDVLNSSCLNTLRIVTYIDRMTRRAMLWDNGFIRIGGGGDVDNFWAGGVAIPINKDGTLQADGITARPNHTMCRLKKSPTTGVLFAGYKIPFYLDAVKLCLQAHSLFPRVKSIGWDVGITENGPILIEGNHDWGNDIVQVVKRRGDMEIYRKAYE